MSRPLVVKARRVSDGKETFYASQAECAKSIGITQGYLCKILKQNYVIYKGYRLTLMGRWKYRTILTAPDGTETTYENVWDAAEAIGGCDQTIRRMIRYGKKNRDGYTARYADFEAYEEEEIK